MSDGVQHRDDTSVNREEHAVDGGVTRKRVGLFAKDALGTGVIELSALSTASGAALQTHVLDPGGSGGGGGVTTVFQGGNWDLRSLLSTTTIYAVVNTGGSAANVTLNPSPNQIGSVTVSNQLDIRSILSAPTLNVVTQAITVNSGMLTLFPGPSQIGSVTISNNPTLGTGTNFIGLATVSVANTVGNATLNPGPNQIGSVTVSNFPTTQPVSFAQLVSLASGTEVRSLATILNALDIRSILSAPTLNVVTQAITVNSGMLTLFPGPNQIGSVTISNQPPLIASSAYIGLASVNVGNVVNSIATIAPRTDYIGLMSVSGNVVVSNFVSPNVGNVTLNPGPSQIGSVTISNMQPLVASSAYVGLATTVQARSATTLFAGYASASGYTTIFVPPSGQKFYIHSVLINSKGNSDGFIGASTNAMIPWTSLATYGGFPYQHETPGLPATLIDQSLTIRQYSIVTLSYSISTHFETS